MVRRARPIVRAASGIILAKRVLLDELAIGAESAVNFDNPTQVGLAICQEAQDEEVISDGTNVAQVPLYSRLVALRLNLFVRGASGANFRWILHKLPDGEELVADATRLTTGFHSMSDSPAQREFRKLQMAKGFFPMDSSGLKTNVPIFVRKSALRRVAPLRENDVIRLDIASSSSSSSSISGFGTLWFRANG